MSLRNYLVRSDGPYEEILGSFQNEEIVQLYNQLKADGGKSHYDYVKSNLTDILSIHFEISITTESKEVAGT